jgi:neutral ceramidase
VFAAVSFGIRIGEQEMQLKTSLLTCVLILASPIGIVCQTVPAGAFRVGAAKVDITPAQNELPKNYLGVLDRVYSRAIAIDNGQARAVLISLDAGVVPTEIWKTVSDRIEKDLAIPSVNVLITATHSHSVPGVFPMFPRPGANPEPPDKSRIAAYEDKVFESAKLAKDGLQPARISYGTGVSYLNVQRDIIDSVTHRWWEGANYSGLSDKTVAAIKFESLNGDPIAVYYNYAMHAVINGVLDLVSGDVPGAASRYIESHFNDKVVALWSEGAAGDQNPIYFQQTFDLRKIRIDDYAKQGKDISNAMLGGGQGMDRNNPEVIHLMDEQKELTNSMGQLLGEEVLRIMREAKNAEADGRLFGKVQTITCPGRERLDQGRAGINGTYKDGPPVEIKLGLLMIDDIAIGTVDAEVYNLIAQRLKTESPYAKTIMATLTNGMANSGYIPDDASFGHNTFEVLSSRLQPGCAETGIVNGIVEMMPRVMY